MTARGRARRALARAAAQRARGQPARARRARPRPAVAIELDDADVRARAVDPAPARRLDRARRRTGRAHARADAAARDRGDAARRGGAICSRSSRVTRAELERAVLAWIAEGVDAPADEARFERARARAVPARSTRGGAAYRRLCAAFGVDDPERVKHWREIPPVPDGRVQGGAARDLPARCDACARSAPAAARPRRAAQLQLDDLALYDASLLATFARFIVSRRRAHPLRRCSRPRPPTRPTPRSRTCSSARCDDARNAGQPLLRRTPTAGTPTRAIAELADAVASRLALAARPSRSSTCSTRSRRAANALALPAGTRVMETGGFKGRSRELTRDELHGAIAKRARRAARAHREPVRHVRARQPVLRAEPAHGRARPT